MCICRRSQEKILIVLHAPLLQLGRRGVKNFRRNFYFGVGVCWGVKRFTLFSYFNCSFILSRNVKVCIRFIVFLQISLFFICQELPIFWEGYFCWGVSTPLHVMSRSYLNCIGLLFQVVLHCFWIPFLFFMCISLSQTSVYCTEHMPLFVLFC